MNANTNQKTNTGISLIGMFVIDVLRYDIENTSSITRLLNDTTSIGWRFAWTNDFTESEVIKALKELLNKKLVSLLREEKKTRKIILINNDEKIWSDINLLWFELTEKGKQIWNEWENPPIEDEYNVK